MGFEGPDAADYQNVAALNRAWLELLQRNSTVQTGLDKLASDLQQRLTNLSRAQIDRLSQTPFLLFSFRESEESYWTRTLSTGRDLFSIGGSEDADTLISAGLGFAWQLARKNPYALRLICGATLYWSERIAELTFFQLLDAVRASGDLPVIRNGHGRDMWRGLLQEGVSRQKLSRHAVQVTALQALLTHASTGKQETWPLAASAARAPGRRVAEPNETTQD